MPGRHKAGIGIAGFLCGLGLAVDDCNLVAILQQTPSGRYTRNTASQHQYFHGVAPKTRLQGGDDLDFDRIIRRRQFRRLHAGPARRIAGRDPGIPHCIHLVEIGHVG